MKPRIVLPLLALVSVVVLAAAVVFRPLPTTITRENAARIQLGMSYVEVADILGETRDEVTGFEIPGAAALIVPSGVNLMGWRGETTHVRIRFQSGKVAEVEVFDTQFPSTLAHLTWRVRRSLGLPIGEDAE